MSCEILLLFFVMSSVNPTTGPAIFSGTKQSIVIVYFTG